MPVGLWKRNLRVTEIIPTPYTYSELERLKERLGSI